MMMCHILSKESLLLNCRNLRYQRFSLHQTSSISAHLLYPLHGSIVKTQGSLYCLIFHSATQSQLQKFLCSLEYSITVLEILPVRMSQVSWQHRNWPDFTEGTVGAFMCTLTAHVWLSDPQQKNQDLRETGPSIT